jgi:hypothetical protein
MSKPQALRFNYHDALLLEFRLGPRREVELLIQLDPVWNNSAPEVIKFRLSAIDNYEEVENFFVNHFPQPRLCQDTIDSTLLSASQCTVSFDRSGCLSISSSKVQELVQPEQN